MWNLYPSSPILELHNARHAHWLACSRLVQPWLFSRAFLWPEAVEDMRAVARTFLEFKTPYVLCNLSFGTATVIFPILEVFGPWHRAL